MDKYIGFDVDSNKTVACVIQEGKKDVYQTLPTARLDARLSKHPGGHLLMTMPGVGPRTAETVLAYTDEVERFASGKQYCSYFGMTPKLDESGSFRRLGHISKQGPSVVRWLIVESAWRAPAGAGVRRGLCCRR